MEYSVAPTAAMHFTVKKGIIPAITTGDNQSTAHNAINFIHLFADQFDGKDRTPDARDSAPDKSDT